MIPSGVYRGTVDGVESGRCVARIEVRELPGGGFSVDYEASSEVQGLQHAEHTLVTPGALYVAHSEAPGVTVFARAHHASPAVEGNPAGEFDSLGPSPYQMRIVIGWNGTELTWSWHWAMSGEPLREQSCATVRLA
jgi:hypothetical protein